MYPLRCSDCHEHFFDEGSEGDEHCCEPRDHGEAEHGHGTLAFDFSYDFREEDPNIP